MNEIFKSIDEIYKSINELKEKVENLKNVIDPKNELPFDPRMALKIDEIELSVRARNSIKKHNKEWAIHYPEEEIIYLGDLIQRSPIEMSFMPNVGSVTLKEFNCLADSFNIKIGTKLIGFNIINIKRARKKLQELGIIKCTKD